MRIGALCVSSYNVKVRPTKTERAKAVASGTPLKPKTAVRYQARYKVYVPGQKPREVKQGGFTGKKLADSYLDTVRWSVVGHDGWRLDDQYHPVPPPDPALGAQGISCVALAMLYWNVRWPSIGPSQRSKIRGRLLVWVASTLEDPQLRSALLVALKRQRPARRVPEPRTEVERVAAWMHASLFDRPAATDEHHQASSPEGVAEGSAGRGEEGGGSYLDWLEARSLSAEAVDDTVLTGVRAALGGSTHDSQRTYWTCIASLLTWAVETQRLPRDPSIGMPKLSRDLDAERCDPQRTPGESEVLTIASAMQERLGHWGYVFILVIAFCALRIGEAVNLRRCSVEFTKSGGAWVTVESQDGRQTARHSDDGSTTRRDGAPTKGRRQRSTSRRSAYVPSRWARHLQAYLDSGAVGPGDDALLFTGARGGWLDPDYFRRTYWHPVIDELFTSGHRLSGIDPHSLRHFGMSRWLRANLPFKMIQKMGGWRSLKVMLDTYAAVLPDDEDLVVRRLEEGA